MLKAMRDSSQSVLIYVLFGLLVFVFAVNFGPGSGACNTADVDYAAKVDGDIIRREDFVVTYQAQMEYQRKMGGFGAGIDDERLQAELRRRVIDELIDTRLLTHEARRLGMTVTDDELLRYLQQRYRVNDVDFEQYESWVQRNFRTSAPKFEYSTRGDIIAQRLEEIVRDAVSISDEELKDQYLREHDRAMVTYVRFSPRDYPVAEPTAAAIDALLGGEADAVKARFEQDIFKYRTPERRQTRQILMPLAADASDADVATARGKLIDLKTQIEGGADFAALAAKESGDPASKSKGGDLGSVERGRLAKPLEDVVFALSAGSVGDPVRSPQGLHLLQVTEIKPPGRQELEAVQRDVAKDMLRDRAQAAQARAAADKLRAELAAGKNLEALTWTREEQRDHDGKDKDEGKAKGKGKKDRAVADAKPVRNDSAWILKSDTVLPGIGEDQELHTAIFGLTDAAPLVPGVHEVGHSFFVVKLKERELPDAAALDKDKKTLRDQAVWNKRSQVFRSWVKHLRDKARVELNPDLFTAPPSA